MHAGGFKLTKLTDTRLEDNLIRHRGDRLVYVMLALKDVARISVLPFPAYLNKSNGAQQLTRSVKAAMSDIFMRCDDRCTEGVRSPLGYPVEITQSRRPHVL